MSRFVFDCHACPKGKGHLEKKGCIPGLGYYRDRIVGAELWVVCADIESRAMQLARKLEDQTAFLPMDMDAMNQYDKDQQPSLFFHLGA